jgi:uncharacterized protein YcfJ
MRAFPLAAIVLGFILQPVMALPLAAQQQTAAAPAGSSPAAALGLFAFPGKGQTKEQQLADEQECYTWAKDQTGIDPTLVKANPDSAAKAAAAKMDSAATGAAVVGAAKGAAAGALIGGVTGNSGDGAAAGAVGGAIAGRRAKKAATAQAAQAGAQQNAAQVQALMDKFKKAMTACLEGKGYSVK